MQNCQQIPHKPVKDPKKFCDDVLTQDDLKKLMMELFIRFDTDPKLYTKWDYLTLLRLLKNLICRGGDCGDFEKRISDLEEAVEKLQEQTLWVTYVDGDDPILIVPDADGKSVITIDEGWNNLMNP